MMFCGLIILLLPMTLAYSRKSMALQSELQANNPIRESGITKQITKPGNGKQIEAGDVLAVKYRALAQDNQLPFAQGSRETFVVKDGSMIKCWDMAVMTMKVHEKATFHCKADLAYGKNGIANVIPANSDIVLEIEVLASLGTQLPAENLSHSDPAASVGSPTAPGSAAKEIKKAEKENMFDGSVLDIYKRRLASASFGFAGSGFFTSQSGEKAPWYLNPNLTFPAMIAIVSAAFLTVFLNGAVREKGVSMGGGELISRAFETKTSQRGV